ncbi:MAG: hypothetical protein WKG07_15535 [Hymenobacter sp.]
MRRRSCCCWGSLSLFGLGWCLLYLGFILFLPLRTPIALLLLLGFAMGLAMDISYDTGGLHAAAAVLLAYLRRLGAAPAHAPRRLRCPGHRERAPDGLAMVPGVFAAAGEPAPPGVFFPGAGLVSAPLRTLARVGVSILFTSTALLIVQLLFFPVRRGRS